MFSIPNVFPNYLATISITTLCQTVSVRFNFSSATKMENKMYTRFPVELSLLNKDKSVPAMAHNH